MRWRRIVPDAIAATGDTLWVADASRPCLLQVRHGELVDVHWWSAPDVLGSGATRLHADENGVWVVAQDGVFHCDGQGATSLVLGEPVGATAHAHSLLAAALPSTWPTRTGPDRVRLLSPRGARGEVQVPGAVHELATTGDGFLAYVVDHGPSGMTPLLDRGSRLASLDLVGEIRLGPPLGQPHLPESGLVGGTSPAVVVADRWPPRLTSVLDDLSTAPAGLPFVPLDLWAADSWGRAVVWSHLPDGSGQHGWWPLAEPAEAPLDRSYLLTVVDMTRGQPVGNLVIAGYPSQVAMASPELVWVSMQRTDTDGRHVVLAWDLAPSDTVAELDLTAIAGSRALMPITPPVPERDLPDLVEGQRRSIAGLVEAEGRSFEIVDVVTQGAWPQCHVVVRFRVPGLGLREGAFAWPLFDSDGQPTDYDWTDYVSLGIDEEVESDAFKEAMLRTPDEQPVWLRRPTGIEGLLPES